MKYISYITMPAEAVKGDEKIFTDRCPDVRFIVADAEELKTVLDREVPGKKISAVVSSLPFRTLGPRRTENILRELDLVLRKRGGMPIQYRYALRLKFPLQNNRLTPISTSIVWGNLPPARVESYRPGSGSGHEADFK
ncbi:MULTISPECIES: hypothetical protein [unclassified Desulfovibrio]|uniref:hypothetical protein n=1 Tax=unclassified Desulfovibrio TaxID=2593640 RepID=UPI000F5FB0AC|nr:MULTISPECIES: hypothetical protein [unclassified Desulfovibrio]RRD69614.1 hypothetical protein EII24_09345 [Desulfovibrio sp. OH1209_COT-279]RRD86267.1 hypothetical protein EII23_09345 [Desulfovibrio sp. OH1186_COT-070]